MSDVQQAVAQLKTLAEQAGRPLQIGLRIDVLARETEEEAIFDARRHAEQTQHQPSLSQAGLWRGLTTSSTGAAGVLVGSFAQVQQQLADYAAAGVSQFILGAVPSLEEAYRVGENVLPALRAQLGLSTRLAA
ncbi:LLM class flavin-dependent oxidoreductase [Methylobacillus glycogenes]|uniref:LLM class flavin-dependent oxidoreductase n=1 Tax=Methylobacillus glycogenes TaxID=406 RepID=UPI000A7A2DF2|nr:LLM class flavin-dependent oxidoreductase [Methylobacillus glycogenes]